MIRKHVQLLTCVVYCCWLHPNHPWLNPWIHYIRGSWSQLAKMWIQWNTLLKPCVNKGSLHVRALQLKKRVYYVKIIKTFKRVDTIKTCVAAFRFSRKISGLRTCIDRYQSAHRFVSPVWLNICWLYIFIYFIVQLRISCFGMALSFQ